MAIAEKPSGEKGIPQAAIPLIEDWFNPDSLKGRGAVPWEIKRIFSGKVRKLKDAGKRVSTSSEEGLRYQKRAVACGQDIIREVLEETSQEVLSDQAKWQDLTTYAVGVAQILRALKSGEIVDGGFWKPADREEFVKAQDDLFGGMDLLASEVAARYDMMLVGLTLPKPEQLNKTG